MPLGKLARVVREELSGLHPRLLLIQALLAPLPAHVGSRMRVYALRAAGFQIGHGCVMWGLPTITGGAQLYTNLTIGRNCVFNVGCFFDLGAPIGIGDQVAVGHQVMLLTNSHELGPRSYRAGPLFSKPITIEDGAWLGARSVVLPGVSIGTGAVVAAGAVVAKNVAPNTIVGGVPAQVIRSLAP